MYLVLDMQTIWLLTQKTFLIALPEENVNYEQSPKNIV